MQVYPWDEAVPPKSYHPGQMPPENFEPNQGKGFSYNWDSAPASKSSAPCVEPFAPGPNRLATQ
jgi:hypothetical protein